ncbi:copper resistance CopC family protein [Nocardioides sp.]|uniref:copper resistance CopC family protein n=1 Tax=Nocardioides sp. TaxID=35761 RepID=UPI00260B4F59|nr:copper resistance CopC family protein [Nocardioides sp.]MCW2736731.1 copper resistance protein CopC [Nocardioides sp.]
MSARRSPQRSASTTLRTGNRMPRGGVLAAVLVAVLAAGPGVPASAHAELLASSPGAGEAVPLGVDELLLSFAQEVLPGSGSVQVEGPGGEDVTSGEDVVEDSLVRVPIAVQDSGTHTVGYRVVAADGHVVVGDFSFDVVAGAPGRRTAATLLAPAAGTATGPQGTSPRLLWGGYTVALCAALLVLHAQRRRLRGATVAPRPVPAEDR